MTATGMVAEPYEGPGELTRLGLDQQLSSMIRYRSWFLGFERSRRIRGSIAYRETTLL